MNLRQWLGFGIAGVLAGGFLIDCGSSQSATPRGFGGDDEGTSGDVGTGGCSPGSERCVCAPGNLCLHGLLCLSGVCVNPGSGGATPSAGAGGATATGASSIAANSVAVSSVAASSVAASSVAASSVAASSVAASSTVAVASSSTGAGGLNCSDSATAAGTLTKQYGSAQIPVSGTKSYFLQTNWWHLFSAETEPYNGLSFTVANPNGAAVSPSDGDPMGFPSLFIGQYAGNKTIGSNLPKQVSTLTTVPTLFKTNSSSIGLGGHNATYDVWFTANNQALTATQSSPGAGGAYMMVWLFKPYDRQPRGSDAGHTGQSVSGVPGTWDVWIDNTDPPCISYVSTTPIDGLTFDLNDFIKHTVAAQYGITNSMYLNIVFAGFEIWGGNNGLEVEQFCAEVN